MAETEATRASNGAAPPETSSELPVKSYCEAAPFLRRPFTPQAVKFKVQATWGNGPTDALIVAYIDARLVIERLNHVCPDLWHHRFGEPTSEGLICWLTVDGITREDIGAEYKGKGLRSDALKRAAVHFGVGVSLYAIPKIVLKVADKHVQQKQVGQKKTLVLTAAGEERCRNIYAMWLDTKGRQAFGEPLDHGDVEDAAGDPTLADTPAETDSGDAQLDPARVQHIVGGFAATKTSYTGINLLLGSIGVDGLEAESKEAVLQRISGLTAKQADDLSAALERVAQDQAAESGDQEGGDDARS